LKAFEEHLVLPANATTQHAQRMAGKVCRSTDEQASVSQEVTCVLSK